MCFIISKKLSTLAATTTIVLLLVKVNLSQSRCCESEDEIIDKKTIYMFLMLPYPDPLGRKELASFYDDGHEIAPAAYLAVEEINNRSDILQGYKLELIQSDGGCNVIERTVVSFTKDIAQRNVPVAGIVGPTCLEAISIVSQLVLAKRDSLVSIAYIHDFIGNNQNVFALPGVGFGYGPAYLQLVQNNNWKRVALLLTDSVSYSLSALRGILRNNTEYKIVYQAYMYDSYIPLERVRESFTRVIFVTAPPRIARKLLCLAYHADMVYPNYQYIFNVLLDQDFFGTNFYYAGKHYNCSTKEIHSALKGSMSFFEAFTPETDTVETFSGLTYPQFFEGYKTQIEKYKKKFKVNSVASYWAAPAYDATWTLAIALNISLEELKEKNITFSQEDLARQEEITDIIQKNMFNVDFQGITGHRMKFDRQTRELEKLVNIFMYNGSAVGEKIAKYKSGNLTLLSHVQENSTLFIDYKFDSKYNHVNYIIAALLLTLATGSVILAIPAQVINAAYRNHKSIKASSYKLNNIIFVGCYVVTLGIVLHTISQTLVLSLRAHSILCNLFPICSNIGLTLIIATVFFKTWRLYIIYDSFGKPKFPFLLKEKTLSSMVGLLFLFESVAFTVWMVVDPLQAYKNTHLKHFQGAVPVIVTNVQCKSSWSLPCIIFLGLCKGILLLLSLVFAILVHKMQLKSSRFQQFTANNIIILAYLLSILVAIAVPVYLIVIINSDDYTVHFLVMSISLCATVYICLLVLFLPSVVPVFKDKIKISIKVP